MNEKEREREREGYATRLDTAATNFLTKASESGLL